MWMITGIEVIVFTGSSLPHLLSPSLSHPTSSFLPFLPTTAISHPVAFLASVNAVLKRTHAVDSTAENLHHLESEDASSTLPLIHVLSLASGHVPEIDGLVANTWTSPFHEQLLKCYRCLDFSFSIDC